MPCVHSHVILKSWFCGEKPRKVNLFLKRLRLGNNMIHIPNIISNKCIKCTVILWWRWWGFSWDFFFFKTASMQFWNINWSSNALSIVKTRKLIIGLHFAVVNKILISLAVCLLWFVCLFFSCLNLYPLTFFPLSKNFRYRLNSGPLVLNASSLRVRVFIEVFPDN